ncbi:MAG: hypothetical protein ACI837_000928 [Crocinitomicaceae bacterium]|jgi:hypothetical protein
MTDTLNFEDDNEQKSRPGFLTTLCILSFVSIGLALVLSVFNIIHGKANDDELFEKKVAYAEAKRVLKQSGSGSFTGIYDQFEAMELQTNDNFYFASLIGFLTSFIGLAGVLMMFKGRKIGFHIYIIYSLIAMGGMYLYISPANIPSILTILSAVFSGLFILLYSRNLHWMKA